jgi:quercetin dioxygenase-like cupin family protein
MTSSGKLILAALAGCVLGMWAQRHTPLTITRLYTGPDGQSRAEQVELKMAPSTLRSGLDEAEPLNVPGAKIMRWPRGYVWEWHNATHRQYVVTLSGQAEVEVADGKKMRMNPGQIVMAEDVAGKGHVTRSVGSEDLVLLLIPFAAQ